jgi:AcrR family transcriptional regulator
MRSKIRDQIIAAAVQCLGETGVRGTSTKEIADRAGVNETSLFRLFGDKSQLMYLAMQHIATERVSVERVLAPFHRTKSFRRAIHALADEYATAFDRCTVRATYFARLELPTRARSAQGWVFEFVAPIAARIQLEQSAGRARRRVNPKAAALMLHHILFQHTATERIYGLPRRAPLGPFRPSLHAIVDIWLTAICQSK